MPATSADLHSAGSGVEMSKPVGTVGSGPADSAEGEEQPLLSGGLANSSRSHTSAGHQGRCDLSKGPHVTIQSLAWKAPQLRCWPMLRDTSKYLQGIGKAPT